MVGWGFEGVGCCGREGMRCSCRSRVEEAAGVKEGLFPVMLEGEGSEVLLLMVGGVIRCSWGERADGSCRQGIPVAIRVLMGAFLPVVVVVVSIIRGAVVVVVGGRVFSCQPPRSPTEGHICIGGGNSTQGGAISFAQPHRPIPPMVHKSQTGCAPKKGGGGREGLYEEEEAQSGVRRGLHMMTSTTCLWCDVSS